MTQLAQPGGVLDRARDEEQRRLVERVRQDEPGHRHGRGRPVEADQHHEDPE